MVKCSTANCTCKQNSEPDWNKSEKNNTLARSCVQGIRFILIHLPSALHNRRCTVSAAGSAAGMLRRTAAASRWLPPRAKQRNGAGGRVFVECGLKSPGARFYWDSMTSLLPSTAVWLSVLGPPCAPAPVVKSAPPLRVGM